MKNIQVKGKLGSMRKTVDWTVYPQGDDKDIVIVQSNRRICRFSIKSQKGVLSASHNYPCFATLQMRGAKAIHIPQEFIDQVMDDKVPVSGDQVAPGLYIK